MKKTLFALFLFTLFLRTEAQTYYVSPAGSDNAAGTSVATAWKTIAKVNSVALPPGAAVLFEGSQTFQGSLALDQADGNDPAHPVTISSYGNGKAKINSGAARGLYAYNTQGIILSDLVFEGGGMYTNNEDGLLFYTDLGGGVKLAEISLENIEVSQYGKTGIFFQATSISNTGFRNVAVDGVHVHHVKKDGIVTRGFTMQSHTGWAHENIIIRNSEIDNVSGYADNGSHRGSGIIMAQVNGGLIEKCAAHHNGAGNTHCGGPGGIWAWDCNNVIIQFCESYKNSSGTGCDGLGFDLDGGVTNSVMQYNYSHDNDGAGYLLGQYDYARGWSNNVVRYNISENDGRTNGGGFTLFKGPGTTMSGCRIYNNTVYTSSTPGNSGTGCFTIIDWYSGINDIEVYNNIFQSAGGAYLVDIPVGYSAAFAGNLYWSSGAAFRISYQGNMYGSLAAWRSATGCEQAGALSTGVSANPLLGNAGAGVILYPAATTQLSAYQLGAGSPAVDAGMDLSALFGIATGTQDYFGNPALSGTAGDIGAHERTSGMTTGITRPSETQLVCYPNPVQAGEPIRLGGIAPPYTCELFSISGACVWRSRETAAGEMQVPTTSLSPGPYLVVAVDASGRRKTFKMIVQ
jgi:hypothetical protein